MRELKFRAWDEDRRQMFTHFHIELYTPDGADFSVIAPGSKQNGDYQNLILMQYTGLKDKNGVEIYEGDVLQYEEWHHGVNEIMDDAAAEKAGKPINHMIRCEVVFACGGFRYQEFRYNQQANAYGRMFNREPNYGSELSYGEGDIKHMEVIGNIHANPELLETSEANQLGTVQFCKACGHATVNHGAAGCSSGGCLCGRQCERRD